jgi:7-keto-8-aminopelargonate synthetase-like enzyme
VFGPAGAGLVAEEKLQSSVTVCMGTLSKAVGAYGGFVACSEHLRAWLVNKARSFMYTTALPPAVVAAALAGLEILKAEPGLGAALRERARFLRERLTAAGLSTGNSRSPIIPVIVGDNKKTVDVSERLRAEGVLAIAIRPPTVPAGTARLRLSVTLAHSEEALARAASLIANAARTEGVL